MCWWRTKAERREDTTAQSPAQTLPEMIVILFLSGPIIRAHSSPYTKVKTTKTRTPITSPSPALPIFSFIHHPRLGPIQSLVDWKMMIVSHLSEIFIAVAVWQLCTGFHSRLPDSQLWHIPCTLVVLVVSTVLCTVHYKTQATPSQLIEENKNRSR